MALLSELKILIHLGQHLNIVNLLGAVTKDIRFGKCRNKKIIFFHRFYVLLMRERKRERERDKQRNKDRKKIQF